MINIETTINLTEETRDIVSEYLERIHKKQAKRKAERNLAKRTAKVYNIKNRRFVIA